MKATQRGFTLIELMIVIAIIAIIAAIAIPGMLAAQRSSNERSASASLKTISTAQADFRSNDRDNNRIADFWCADIYALFGLFAADSTGAIPADSATSERAIKLIEHSIAQADGQQLATGATYGNITIPAGIAFFTPKAGYIFQTFDNMEVAAGAPTTLLNDTDGAAMYGPVHDLSRYAFAAFPDTFNDGRQMFVIAMDGVILKRVIPAGYRANYAGGGTSTTNVTGTGIPILEGIVTFPSNPAALGFSKLD